MDTDRWLAHFRRNQQHRPEPDWDAPVTLSAPVRVRLVRALQQLVLIDGGGPCRLTAWDAERRVLDDAEVRRVIELWFLEEREHSRLLRGALRRFGGQPIRQHWFFAAFLAARRWFGVEFELLVMLLSEIAVAALFRLMRRHADDPALCTVCTLILRDEAGHIAVNRDRMAARGPRGLAFGLLWELCFRVLGLFAATLLWINQGRAMRALGSSAGEFYGEAWLGLTRFIRRLRRDAARRRQVYVA